LPITLMMPNVHDLLSSVSALAMLLEGY